MEHEDEVLIEVVRSRLGFLSQEERRAMLKAIMEGWCERCGAESPCFCWEDK